MILNNTEKCCAFILIFELNVRHRSYENVKLETCHVPAVNDLRTSTGTRTSTFSRADLVHLRISWLLIELLFSINIELNRTKLPYIYPVSSSKLL